MILPDVVKESFIKSKLSSPVVDVPIVVSPDFLNPIVSMFLIL